MLWDAAAHFQMLRPMLVPSKPSTSLNLVLRRASTWMRWNDSKTCQLCRSDSARASSSSSAYSRPEPNPWCGQNKK